MTVGETRVVVEWIWEEKCNYFDKIYFGKKFCCSKEQHFFCKFSNQKSSVVYFQIHFAHFAKPLALFARTFFHAKFTEFLA